MNEVYLRGTIKNIEYSHEINGVEYDKAILTIPRENGLEDVINLKFKKFSNPYSENDLVELVGNVRSYSKEENGKNKVNIYVFTYFDKPYNYEKNSFIIDGRICKKDILRTTSKGKENFHFILANNIKSDSNSRKLNSYLPCVAWGELAKKLESMPISTPLEIRGELHSRLYNKVISNNSDNVEMELKMAHELIITEAK